MWYVWWFRRKRRKCYIGWRKFKYSSSHIPLSYNDNINNEFVFNLEKKEKSNNEKIEELTQIIIAQNSDIEKLKNEINDLQYKDGQSRNEQIRLNQEIIQLKLDKNILSNKIEQLCEYNKGTIIWNLDSKIIGDNIVYNQRLKNFISPSETIKAELLYRLSENGEQFSTFHELCDNKDCTLILFYVDEENIVGIYSPLSWDSFSEWKNDLDTFIFNVNKNSKFEKLKPYCSIYCNGSRGLLHQILDVIVVRWEK